MKQQRPNKLRRLYFVPQRDLIVGACSSEPNGSIRFWSIDDGKLKEVLDLGKSEWAVSLAVSNYGTLLVASLLVARDIGCYSLTEKRWLWKGKWVGKGVADNATRFTPDGRKVVIVGFRDIVTYDARSGAILQRQEDSQGFSDGFPNYKTRNNGISPSGRYAAFWQGNLGHDEGWWSSRNIWVLVRDIEREKVIAKQGRMQSKYKNCSAAFTPDEKNLLLGSMDGHVRVWSVTEQKTIKDWKACWHDNPSSFEENPAPNAIDSMTFSADGRQLATMGFDTKSRFAIRIWGYSTKELLHQFVDVYTSGMAMCSGYPMEFSADGKYFAFEQQGKLCLYDTQTWREKWCVPTTTEGLKKD